MVLHGLWIGYSYIKELLLRMSVLLFVEGRAPHRRFLRALDTVVVEWTAFRIIMNFIKWTTVEMTFYSFSNAISVVPYHTIDSSVSYSS